MTLVWPGKPYPLGATWDGQGVNFALFSQHATGVELCLLPAAGHAVMSDQPELFRIATLDFLNRNG